MLGFGATRLTRDSICDPGTMTFAFGRRAYYLYWTVPSDGVGWGANLPAVDVPEPQRGSEHRVERWSTRCAETYADDDPGR